MRERFRGLPIGWRVGIVFVGIALALNMLGALGNRIAPQPAGPPYSSYSTTRDGTAGLAELLERDGREVRKLRGDLADAELDPEATVFLLGADRLASDESIVVHEFLERGGRLVAGGPEPRWLGGAVDQVPDWLSAGSEEIRPLVPAPEVAGVRQAEGNAFGTWKEDAPGLPLLGGEAGPVLVAQDVGPGRALLLADVTPLLNDRLDERDNAALALSLAGEGDRKVIFVEGVHGFGESRGLAALPDDWKWMLAGLGLAGLVGIWAIGRRFGPPEADRRELPPPRRRFVDAQALTLARTHEPSASAEPVRAAARERLARRAALGSHAPDHELRRAAKHFGLPDDEANAIIGPDGDIIGRRPRAGPTDRRTHMRELYGRVAGEVGKVVVGQERVLELLTCTLAVGGHALLQGVPGVAKTLLANSLARALAVEFRRVQFTPDMLPSDLTGTMTLRGGELAFRQGPVFTNLLLADEINRTPPKTQAALLEAMQERQVSVDGEPHPLPDPFLVVATQNPIEYEGTYPLPEAQLDRFLVQIEVDYPTPDEELTMLQRPRRGVDASGGEQVQPVAGPDDLRTVREQVDATEVRPEVARYVLEIVRKTRELPSVTLGASPRAAVHLLAASKACARLYGRSFVTPDDVGYMAGPVLRHRLVLTPEAELERYGPDEAVNTALGAVPVPALMTPTPRAAVVLALVALSALFLPLWLSGLLAVAVAGAVVADALIVRRVPRVERSHPAVLARGVPAPLDLELSRGEAAGVARVRQPIPPDVRLEPREADWHLEGTLTPIRRGRHPLPAAAVRAVGPLGLGAWYHRAGEEGELLVYPDLPSARRIALAVARGRFLEGGQRGRGPLGLGTEFESIRDYLPDDDVRQVNWRATARMGRAMSNQYRVDRDRELMCLVDCGRLMAAPLGELTRLDATIDAVTALALVADELGDRIGAVAFDAEIRHHLRPRRDGGRTVVRTLFDVEPASVESDYELAFRIAEGAKRSFVLVLTDLLEPAAAESLVEAVPVLAKRHEVVVASVADDDLARAITTPPERELDVYAAAAAVDVLDARAEAATLVRRAGASVIEAPPGDLGAACVRAYLRAKARARL